MAGKIFISYRRSETAWAARAVFERLRRVFPDDVFIDLEGISPGIDFVKVIGLHLEGCHAMMAMIGAEWLREIHERGPDHQAHAANEEDGAPDHVRIELAQALSRGIPVVPVLVDEARMPAAKDLPPDLKALARRHAVELPWKFFEAQMGLLEKELRKVMPAAGPVAKSVAATPSPSHPATVAEAKAAIAPPAVIRNSRDERWMSNEGEDQYGRWADIQANGETQRLRWIPPGRFRMGSPPSEAGRYGDEGPQHEVTLTRGFWLADTACTQALWQAVVGSNPSRFKGDLQCPVENVSWDDVTGLFLPQLKPLVSGVEVMLPTEAEWEYACRAGTTTAYSFGDTFDPAKVHVQAKETVPVKALPANAWGLYQMHGNVWEWCADARRSYTAEPMEDPNGGQDGVVRVLRGGSWDGVAWRARSACRNGFARGDRFQFYGFRFALRSIEPGAGGR